jgi:hypothetical protein
MGDLYLDDIEDRSYTDEMILSDVEALVRSGQREGTVIDYKSDVSEQDNWPQTVAAFANSFGGLIVFGVEGKNDQPRRVTGFDPKGIEIKTKLASMVIDRVQPRPDFSVRVATFDNASKREIALVRIAEGRNPPYMHSKDQEHRVYVRIGAQKAEADYLQLLSLFEKRERAAPHFEGSPERAFGTDPNFFIADPDAPERASSQFFRFVVVPPSDIGGPMRLNRETERRFAKCVGDIQGTSGDIPSIRSPDATAFRVSGGPYREQRFALSAFGPAGFVSYPAIRTNHGPMFVPEHFCRYLLDFLSVASLFYERAARFYGPLQLYITTTITGGADIFDGLPNDRSNRVGGAYLFDPPLNHVSQHMQTGLEVSMHPVLANRLLEYLETVLTDIARPHGSVLSAEFRGSMKGDVDDAVARLLSARNH